MKRKMSLSDKISFINENWFEALVLAKQREKKKPIFVKAKISIQ
jgi:hypothetical protein